MKTLATFILCALCACASAYDINMEPSTNSLSKVQERLRNRKRKIVANRPLLTDEERRRKAAESRRIDRTKERKAQSESITAKFAAAKAACGPDCYRVIVTNGVYVGMTKPQYEAYISEKDKKQVAPGYKTVRERSRFQRPETWTRNRKNKRRIR